MVEVCIIFMGRKLFRLLKNINKIKLFYTLKLSEIITFQIKIYVLAVDIRL